MKQFNILLLFIIVLASCAPSKGATQTAISRTQTAPPTLTVTSSKTSEPSQTPTTLPTLTLTKTGTPTVTPTPTPIPPSSILFQKNFEDGDVGKWSYKEGSWIIEQEPNGNHYLSASGPADYPQIWYGDKGLHWTDYALESRVKFIKSSSFALFICVRSDIGATFYGTAIYNYGVGFTKKWSGIDTGIVKSLDPNRWYTIRVEIKGNSLSAYIDNVLVRELKLQPPLINQGGIGYVITSRDKVYFDDIKVWPLK